MQGEYCHYISYSEPAESLPLALAELLLECEQLDELGGRNQVRTNQELADPDLSARAAK